MGRTTPFVKFVEYLIISSICKRGTNKFHLGLCDKKKNQNQRGNKVHLFQDGFTIGL